MITIKVNDKYIDLDENFSITFDQGSPIFSEAITERGYSYPIKIPLSPLNKIIFGFIDSPESIAGFDTFSCTIYSYSNLLIVGILNITGVENGMISGFILQESFNNESLDAPLKSIDMGGDIVYVDGITYNWMYEVANAAAAGDVESWDFCFPPTKNKAFYDASEDNYSTNITPDDIPHTYGGYINLWLYNQQTYWKPPTDNQMLFDTYNPAYTAPSQSTFVPYPYLITIIRHIANHLGYNLAGQWLNDPGIKKLVIYNTYALDFWEYPSGSPYVKNTCNTPINLVNHVPDITIKAFLDALINLFNLSIKINSKEKTITFESKTYLNSLPQIEHTPLKPSAIYPPEMYDGVKISMTQDENDIKQTNISTLIATDIILTDGDTFDTLDPAGSIKFDPDDYYNRIKGSAYIKDLRPSALTYKNGNGKLEITTDISPVPTIRNYSVRYSYETGGASIKVSKLSGIIPIAEQGGNSNEYMADGDFFVGKTPIPYPFSFRLLSYAGLNTDPNGYGVYPFATENIYDDLGNAVLTYSLKWKGGPHSLYDRWWKDWLNILSGKIIIFEIPMTIAQYMTLDMNRKYRIGNNCYYFKSINFTLSQNGLSIVKAKCIQV